MSTGKWRSISASRGAGVSPAIVVRGTRFAGRLRVRIRLAERDDHNDWAGETPAPHLLPAVRLKHKFEGREVGLELVRGAHAGEDRFDTIELRLKHLVDQRAVVGAAVKVATLAGRVIVNVVVAAAAIEPNAREVEGVYFDAAGVQVAIVPPNAEAIVAVGTDEVGEITAAVGRIHGEIVEALRADAVPSPAEPDIRWARIELIGAGRIEQRRRVITAGRGEDENLREAAGFVAKDVALQHCGRRSGG